MCALVRLLREHTARGDARWRQGSAHAQCTLITSLRRRHSDVAAALPSGTTLFFATQFVFVPSVQLDLPHADTEEVDFTLCSSLLSVFVNLLQANHTSLNTDSIHCSHCRRQLTANISCCTARASS